jgi:hypothetical protein
VLWLLECPLELEWPLLVRVWLWLLDDEELEGAYWDGTTELPPILAVPVGALAPRNGRYGDEAMPPGPPNGSCTICS